MKNGITFSALIFTFFCAPSFGGSKWKTVEMTIGDSLARVDIYSPKRKGDMLCVARGRITFQEIDNDVERVTMVAINKSKGECKSINPEAYFSYESESKKCSYREIPALYELLESVFNENPQENKQQYQLLRKSGLTLRDISSIYCEGSKELSYVVGIENPEISEYGFSFSFRKNTQGDLQFIGLSSAVE